MKLSIKIPLIFTLAILAIFLFIGGYLKNYIEDYYLQYITERIKGMVQHDFYMIHKVAKIHKNPGSLRTYLEQMTQSKDYPGNLRVRYQPQSPSGKMITAGTLEKGKFFVSNQYPIYQDQKMKGTLTIYVQPNLEEFGLQSMLYRILLVCLITIIIAFLLLAIFFYLVITKPIHTLNQRLHHVNPKRKPLPPEKERRDEICDLYQNVYKMEQRLHQAYEEQIHMISSIAHDLKTPLTSMQGFLELLQTGTMEEEKREKYLHLIQSKSDEIQRQVENFSSYTKNEYTLLDMKLTPLSVANFFVSVAEEYEAELTGLGYSFLSQHTFAESDCLIGNITLLKRLIANLVSNAIRYADTEDLTLVLTGFREENMAHFLLEDNGVGVPKSDLGKIFSKFHTVDHARQKRQGGSGLGLAICRSIVERHGGEIVALPSRFGGLGVKFTIPLT